MAVARKFGLAGQCPRQLPSLVYFQLLKLHTSHLMKPDLIMLAQREVYNNYTSYFLTSGGFTVSQNNTVVSNTSNVASDAYGKF